MENKLDLSELRAEIDVIDRELAVLIGRRMKVVREVAEYKRGKGIPVHDPARESLVLDKVESLSAEELRPYVKRLYIRMMELSREYEEAYIAREKDTD